MTRSKWKINFFEFNNKQFNKKLKIDRYLTKKSGILIHNGNSTQEIQINSMMNSRTLGEFVLNKKIIKHSKNLLRSTKKVKKNRKTLKLINRIKFLN